MLLPARDERVRFHAAEYLIAQVLLEVQHIAADAAQKVDDIKADEERLAGLQEKADAKVAAAKELVNRLSAEQRASIQSEHLDAYDLAERTYAQAQQIADASGVVEPLLPYNRATNLLRLDRPDKRVCSSRRRWPPAGPRRIRC